jgi:hypothetical protein
MMARKQRQREEGTWDKIYTLQGHAPSDILPPTKLHLLKFPSPPNSPLTCDSINGLIQSPSTAPSLNTANQGPSLQREPLGDISPANHNNLSLVFLMRDSNYDMNLLMGNYVHFCTRDCNAGGAAQVVENLPSKCETLSSIPVLPKKLKRERVIAEHSGQLCYPRIVGLHMILKC